MQRYMPMLLQAVQEGKIDPSFVITHRMNLEDAPGGYSMFDSREDCIKIVLKP